MKKIISVFVSFLLLAAIIIPPPYVFATETCDCSETPIIYIRGRSNIKVDRNPANKTLPYVEDGYVAAEAKRIAPIFAKAYVTGDYSEWKKEFVGVFENIYKDFALNEKGEVSNTTGCTWSWSNDSVRDIHKAGELTTPKDYSDYLYRYFYQYDFRLSPIIVADDLHAYIERIKEVTGHTKIKIISRCLGTSVTAAYLTKYGWADIESIVLYNPLMNGSVVTDTLFSGDVRLNGDSLDYFAHQEIADGDPLTDFLKAAITLLNAAGTIKLPVLQLNKLFAKLCPMVLPDVLRITYGTMPGYWAMVAPDKYEQAKEYVFGTPELKEQYAELIRKNDEYYNSVSKNIYSMFKQIEQDGTKVSIVAKYGPQAYPIADDAKQQSDQIILLSQQSMGSTSALMGEQLSKEYIEKAKANGKDKYISADNVVDASTGLFPDTTWYIKDLEHNNYPVIVGKLIYKILRNDDMTVWTDPVYPQFLVFDGPKDLDSSLTPLTVKHSGTEFVRTNFFVALFRFFARLLDWLVSAL